MATLSKAHSTHPITRPITHHRKSTHRAFLLNQRTRKIHTIEEGTKTLGRNGADITDIAVALDPMVSRNHCVLHMQKMGLCYIEDLNSTNHTYLNDQILESHALVVLNHGDTIRIGRQNFVFQTRREETQPNLASVEVFKNILNLSWLRSKVFRWHHWLLILFHHNQRTS